MQEVCGASRSHDASVRAAVFMHRARWGETRPREYVRGGAAAYGGGGDESLQAIEAGSGNDIRKGLTLLLHEFTPSLPAPPADPRGPLRCADDGECDMHGTVARSVDQVHAWQNLEERGSRGGHPSSDWLPNRGCTVEINCVRKGLGRLGGRRYDREDPSCMAVEQRKVHCPEEVPGTEADGHTPHPASVRPYCAGVGSRAVRTVAGAGPTAGGAAAGMGVTAGGGAGGGAGEGVGAGAAGGWAGGTGAGAAGGGAAATIVAGSWSGATGWLPGAGVGTTCGGSAGAAVTTGAAGGGAATGAGGAGRKEAGSMTRLMTWRTPAQVSRSVVVMREGGAGESAMAMKRPPVASVVRLREPVPTVDFATAAGAAAAACAARSAEDSAPSVTWLTRICSRVWGCQSERQGRPDTVPLGERG